MLIENLPVNLATNYDVLKILGQGGEGTVYLVEDKAGANLVLKVLHNPYPRVWTAGLRKYADSVIANEYGLPVITLLQNSDKVFGIQYPFVQLYQIHWRILQSSEQVAQAIFGAYCRMQSYLMSRYSIGLRDTPVEHFMIARDGQCHFVDLGLGISTIDNRRTLEYGLLGYGVADLLLSIHHINIKHSMLPVKGYSYDRSCIYCMNEELDAVAKQHRWVQDILSDLRSHKASILFDPEFYLHLAERLPSRISCPLLVLSVSNSLFWLAGIKKRGVSLYGNMKMNVSGFTEDTDNNI